MRIEVAPAGIEPAVSAMLDMNCTDMPIYVAITLHYSYLNSPK